MLTSEKLYNCSNPDICLPYYVIPVHYHIKLHIEKYDFSLKNQDDNFTFSGESSTTINILQSTKNIKLHGFNMLIILPKLTFITKNAHTFYQLKESSMSNLIKFHFSNVLNPGLYTLRLKFIGLKEDSTKERTFFRSFHTNKENGIV